MKIVRNRGAKLLSLLLLIVTLVTGFGSMNKANAQPGVNISFQTFYDELSPYGQWFNDPQYGYVWAPNVGRDFRPYYTNGQWMMTEYGNMWVSNYNWGWAPFHYGRWTYNDYYGWIWVPGTEWGPAWVNWRQGGGYYGWAPMAPGISINVSFGPRYNVPNPWWTFIPCGNIYSRSFHRYYSPRRTVNIINNTTIINNTYIDNRSRNTYVTGPRRTDVERITGRRVNVYNVGNENRAGSARVSGRTVNVYRPSVTETGPRGSKPAPREVKNIDRSSSGTTNRGSEARPNNRTEPVNNNRIAPQNINNRAIDSRSSAPAQRQKATRDIDSRNIQPRQNVEQRAQPQQRVERAQPQQRSERAPAMQRAQPRMERSQQAPQRAQPQPRVERAQPQQRMERSSSPRVERSQQAPQRNVSPARSTPARGR